MSERKIVSVGAAAAVVFFTSALCRGQASLDTFQSDTIGSPPANWSITGTNGSTVTADVASEGGGNQFAALRDTSTSQSINAQRLWAGATQGLVRFDIRFNQGVNDYTTIQLFTPIGHQPVELQWFHDAHNTSTPLLFRSRGNGSGFGTTDPNAYAYISTNFPVGTSNWETVSVFFKSDPSPSGATVYGTYSVYWNGIRQDYLMLNQGGTPAQLVVDRVLITPGGSTLSVDIDNVFFVPEPSAALLAAAALPLLLRRRA